MEEEREAGREEGDRKTGGVEILLDGTNQTIS